MKKILTILLLVIAYNSFSQKPSAPRGGSANVVVDQNLRAAQTLYIPQFLDSATASITLRATQDTCGAIVYCYDVDNFYYRACYPYKHWVLVGVGASGLPVLPDGVYSGGNVAWSGRGLIFNVSPASYVLNGIARTYPGGTVTVPPADPTFPKIAVIILDSTGANVVDGVPSVNPQEPSVNPQTQIRRAIVTVPANSLIPAIQTNIIADENLGQPAEWDATSNSTVVFGNTNFPYHLTIAAAATGFVDGDYILMSNDSNYNSSQQGSMVLFIRLGGALALDQNFNINLLDASGNIVGLTLNFTAYGGNRNLVNVYQPLIIPMPEFGSANLIFNKISFTASGAGTFPQFNIDYWQFQNGFTQIFSQQNAITAIVAGDGGGIIANTPTTSFNMNGAGGIFVFANDNTKTLTVSGAGLIRNDLLYGTPQPSSGVSVDGYVKVTNPAVLNGSLSIHGGNSGLGSLVNFEASNTNCCAYVDYNYYNVQENLSPAAVSHSLITLRIGRRNNAFFESGFLSYMYDGNTASTSHIGISFVNPDLTSPIPFIFGADSSFKILRPALGGDNTFKLDVGAKSRFLDAVQSGYLTAGARITDSTLIWKAALDSLVSAKIISNGVTSVATNTATGITGGTITTTGTIAADTTLLATRLYVNNRVASAGTFYNTNVGSGFRLAIPNTNTIKTLLSGYALTWDSATSNSNKISVDTTLMATRAYVGAAGGAGTVSAVSFNPANGFGGSWTNATTTPQLTLTTTITGLLKGNGTALSAAAGTDVNTAFGSQTANFIYAAPNGSAGNPTFRAMVAADVPTLNQNTTGTSATITGVATVAHGGTGLATLTTFGLLAAGTTSTGNLQQVGVGTSGQVLTSNGAGALPTFQAVSVTSGVSSITGTANEIIASGGTGAVTLSTPQPIATTSNVTFQRGTFTGAAATANLILTSHTDPTAAAGVLTNNGTRLAFSLATTYKRFIFSNDVTPAAGQGLFGNGTDFTVGSYTAADNGMVVTASATGVTFKTNSTPQTLTTGATITWNVANGENAILVLANTGATLNLTNPVAGHTYVLRITQGTGGSRTITTWPAGTIWPSGTAPVLGTAVGARNLISLFWDGTNFFGAFNPNIYQ